MEIELLTPYDTFYSEDVFIKNYNLNYNKFIEVLNKTEEKYVLDNSFKYKNRFYLTVAAFMYIVYLYSMPNKFPKSKDIISHCIKGIYNFKKYSYELLGTYIQPGDLSLNSNVILVANKKEYAAYLCVFKHENELILGVSNNPKVRLNYTISKFSDKVELLDLYLTSSLTEARRLESNITLSYHKLRNNKGNFNVNGKVRDIINNRFGDMLIT